MPDHVGLLLWSLLGWTTAGYLLAKLQRHRLVPTVAPPTSGLVIALVAWRALHDVDRDAVIDDMRGHSAATREREAVELDESVAYELRHHARAIDAACALLVTAA